MTFRTRLQLATVLAALIPLTVLAFGVRREMDRRLTEESRRRGEAAVQALGTELRQEHDRLAAPDSAGAQPGGARVIGSLALPFLDARQGSAPDTARLVVTRTSGTLAALQQGLNTWFLVSLGVTALLALLLAAWLSRLVSRPLTDLAEKTAAIDLDRLDAHLQRTSDRTASPPTSEKP